ncbi:MAG: outer membrane beta-barrel protein [Rikenellaceae bacterium]
MKFKKLLSAFILGSTLTLTFAQTSDNTTSSTTSSTGLEGKTVTISSEESKKRMLDSLAIYDPQTFSTYFEEVVVKGRDTRATQKGDSLIYNASAFKVLDGSSAEDLLSKMPGIVVEGGEVQAQGESVGKVLVDGKEFFEGDVNLAIRSLPADIIESVEVFDKQSEQAEFTGFDDGEQIKTINFTTKSGYTQGKFGELYAGYGTDDRYKVGGNVNLFNEDRRISILGMSNNINQQNFSQNDLAGVMSASSSGRRGSSGSSTGMVSNLDGVTSSNAVGLNFVDAWGEKVKFTGSYFFNQSNNEQENSTLREYFESTLPGMTYEEYSESTMDNWNHRFNAKFDYTINENNTLTITPSLSFQSNDKWSLVDGTNLSYGEATENVITDSNSESDAYSLGAEVVYRHKFAKAGRTLSLMLNGTLSNTETESYTDYLTSISSAEPESEDQFQISDTEKYSLRANLVYTEKVADKMQLSVSYRASLSNSDIDKQVYTTSGATYDLYDQLDESLSSVYESDYFTQSGGLGLRYFGGSLSATIGADAQYATLNGVTKYPYSDDINNDYFSILPSFFGRYALDSHNSFMFRYRSSSSSPSVSDLQDVIDNSNPLFMSVGNPNLDQQVNHTASLRYIHTSIFGTSFIAMIGGTLRNNYVADSTMVATTDVALSETITLSEGAQLTKPVNLDGYYSLQAMLTYGFPVDLIYSNINVSLSSSYANVPTILNGVQSNTRELSLVPKVVIGSNISEKLDFTVSYSSALSYALSTETDSSSSDYQTHTTTAKLGWEFWKGITLRSTFNYICYAGIEMDDPNYYLWGASLGKKFLKNRSLEAKIEATDLLNQNRSFKRSVGSNYYDYVNSNVLEGYIMATLVYTFR